METAPKISKRDHKLELSQYEIPTDSSQVKVSLLYSGEHAVTRAVDPKVQLDEVEQIKSKLSPRISKVWAQIPEEHHDISDVELAKMLGPNGPTVLDTRLKTNFWLRYDKKALKLENYIDIPDFITGVCSSQVFKNRLRLVPMVLLFILRRPATYEVVLEDCLTLGINKLRDEILTCKLQFPNGHLDPKAAAVFMQALTFIDNRVRGPLAQRLEIKQETKTMNVNINKTISNTGPVTIEELDSQIRALRTKLDSNAVVDISTHPEDVVPIQIEQAPVNPLDAIVGESVELDYAYLKEDK